MSRSRAEIFFDFSLTFSLDIVSHQRLFDKSGAYGFLCLTLNLFQSYLRDRTQKTSINGMLGDLGFVSCRVLYGIVRDLLFFIVYVDQRFHYRYAFYSIVCFQLMYLG